jgi:hypothetical protein
MTGLDNKPAMEIIISVIAAADRAISPLRPTASSPAIAAFEARDSF